jgi:hypothetical protein
MVKGILISISLFVFTVLAQVKKSDPLAIQSPTNANQSITFQDLQEMKLALYAVMILFLLTALGKLVTFIMNQFFKKEEKTEKLLEDLIESVQSLKSDVRELSTEVKNRPTHDDVIKKIFEYGPKRPV